jgi:retron-type reverse transcriptase
MECIHFGNFPSVLKVSKVIPILKSGSVTDLNNYRPIALQSVLSKTFEKILKKRLFAFFDEHNVLNCNQYGFRSKSSTSLALLDVIQHIEANRDSKKHTVALFLDLSKAFDTVNHSILLKKLESCGCRGLILKLLTSYLTKRQQYTYVNGVASLHKQIDYGVPQGSILGPLLFLVYINDICNSVKAEVKLFADDTVILVSHSNTKALQLETESVINCACNWFLQNRLSLNAKKTVYMYFDANKKGSQNSPPQISINQMEIKPSEITKYLGFLIDKNLSFKPHILSIIQKVSRITGMFKCIS